MSQKFHENIENLYDIKINVHHLVVYYTPLSITEKKERKILSGTFSYLYKLQCRRYSLQPNNVPSAFLQNFDMNNTFDINFLKI